MPDDSSQKKSDQSAVDRRPRSNLDKNGITIHPPVYRDGKGRFAKGSSGNPLGRRPREIRAIGTQQFDIDLLRGMEKLVWMEDEETGSRHNRRA